MVKIKSQKHLLNIKRQEENAFLFGVPRLFLFAKEKGSEVNTKLGLV